MSIQFNEYDRSRVGQVLQAGRAHYNNLNPVNLVLINQFFRRVHTGIRGPRKVVSQLPLVIAIERLLGMAY